MNAQAAPFRQPLEAPPGFGVRWLPVLRSPSSLALQRADNTAEGGAGNRADTAFRGLGVSEAKAAEDNRGTRGIRGMQIKEDFLFRVFRVFRGQRLLPLVAAWPRCALYIFSRLFPAICSYRSGLALRARLAAIRRRGMHLLASLAFAAWAALSVCGAELRVGQATVPPGATVSLPVPAPARPARWGRNST